MLDLDHIRANLSAYRMEPGDPAAQIVADVETLIAEVERLQEESQRRMDKLITSLTQSVDFVEKIDEQLGKLPMVDA